MKKRRIRAVHEYDLETFLDSIGILEGITDGEVTCASCGTLISLENFDSIGREQGELRVYCSNPDCRRQMEE